jgi:hypothetical protein
MTDDAAPPPIRFADVSAVYAATDEVRAMHTALRDYLRLAADHGQQVETLLAGETDWDRRELLMQASYVDARSVQTTLEILEEKWPELAGEAE